MIRNGMILAVIGLWMTMSPSAQTSSSTPILSEFVCNPMDELETEWIELYNPAGFALNLAQYKIGDALGLRDISDTGVLLQPGEYIILAEDPARFREFYSGFDGKIISPDGWQTLNNYGGEVVRLANSTDAAVDSVYYEAGFPDNRSWERFINSEGESCWGESFAATGSTPGQPNTFYCPRVGSIDLIVTPDPFSPDGDGFEDETMIRFDMPEADEFDLAVYDIAGRKVRTFRESGQSIPGEIWWDGRGDDGQILPPGIYIIYARVEGGTTKETKRPVVIAR